MKNKILNISILIITIIMIIGILSFFVGSLEQYPTKEQIEKTRIVSSIIIIVCLIIDVILIRIKRISDLSEKKHL